MAEKITKTIDFDLYNGLNEMDPEDQALVAKARQACDTSYSPYSNFRVGAALLLEDGQVVLGSNQENAAYPDGLCAERVAFFASSVLHPGKRILKVAVAASHADSAAFVAATPCGSCRQVMLEYEGKQQNSVSLITQWNEQQFIRSSSISDLLPFCFTKESLV